MIAKIYIALPGGFDKLRYIDIEHAIPLGEQLAEFTTARADALVAFYKQLRAGDLPPDLCHTLTEDLNTMKTEYVFWPVPTTSPATPPDTQ